MTNFGHIKKFRTAFLAAPLLVVACQGNEASFTGEQGQRKDQDSAQEIAQNGLPPNSQGPTSEDALGRAGRGVPGQNSTGSEGPDGRQVQAGPVVVEDPEVELPGMGVDEGGTATGEVAGVQNPGTQNPPPPSVAKVLSKEYVSSELVLETLKADLVYKRLQQDIVMTRDEFPTNKIYRQIDRPQVTNAFTQGNSGNLKTQTFNQESAGVLDLLVVIDNSGSMSQEQTNLATKLEPLLAEIKDSNWQVAVVTTDEANPCLRALIKKGDANASQAFASAVNAGTNGSGNEQGIKQAVTGLQCAGNPWVRAQSTIGVLIVSDEDNCSKRDTTCKDKPWDKEDYLIDYLASVRSVGVDARAYGIFSHPDKVCNTAANTGTTYAALITKTKGTWGDICAANYGTTLAQISKDVKTILKSQFVLDQTPVPGSLKVYINDTLQTSGYTLTERTLTFTSAPPTASMIRAEYTYISSPILTEFVLSKAPAADALMVMVNGTEIDSKNYRIDGSKPSIIFNQAPADNAEIRVVYKQDLAMTTVFPLPTGIKPDSLKVVVNGITMESGFVVGATSLTFTKPPVDNAEIRISFIVLGDPILSYPFSVASGNPKDLRAYETVGNAPITVTYADGKVTFLANDFKVGRVIAVSYRDESSLAQSFTLPSIPYQGKVIILVDDVQVCQDYATVNDTTLTTQCDFASASSITIKYHRFQSLVQSFTIPDISSADADNWKWQVWIDGVEKSGFTRLGAQISFPGEALPVGAVVKVQATQNTAS